MNRDESQTGQTCSETKPIRLLQLDKDGQVVESEMISPLYTKQEVDYVDDAPTTFKQCQSCEHYKSPDRCGLVQGTINREGVCDLWFNNAPTVDPDTYNVLNEQQIYYMHRLEGQPAAKGWITTRMGGRLRHIFYPDSYYTGGKISHRTTAPLPTPAGPSLAMSNDQVNFTGVGQRPTHYMSTNGYTFGLNELPNPKTDEKGIHHFRGKRVYFPGNQVDVDIADAARNKVESDPMTPRIGGGTIGAFTPAGEAGWAGEHYLVQMDSDGAYHKIYPHELHNGTAVIDESDDNEISHNASADATQYLQFKAANAERERLSQFEGWTEAKKKELRLTPLSKDPPATPASPRMMDPTWPTDQPVQSMMIYATTLVADHRHYSGTMVDKMVADTLPPAHVMKDNVVKSVAKRLETHPDFVHYAHMRFEGSHTRYDFVDDDGMFDSEKYASYAKHMTDAAAGKEEFKDHRESTYHSNRIYEATNDLVALWASTSGDENPQALAMQAAIAKEFNLTNPATGVHRDDWSEYLHKYEDDPNEMHVENAFRAFARATYENTQDWLHQNDIDYLPLSRGMHVPKAHTQKLQELGARFETGQINRTVTNVNLQPASSWATDPQTAFGFANGEGHKSQTQYDSNGREVFHNALLTAVIPRERIYSVARTGPGCGGETEAVVLGGELPVTLHSWADEAGDSGEAEIPMPDMWAGFENNEDEEGGDQKDESESSSTPYVTYEAAIQSVLDSFQRSGTKAAKPEEPELYDIDSDLTNADWTKTMWDLPDFDSPQFHAMLIRQGITLSKFKKLPAFKLTEDTRPTHQKIKMFFASTTKRAGPFKYSSVQANITGLLATALEKFGKLIPEEYLVEDGLETEPHVTIKYGLHTEDPYDLWPVLAHYDFLWMELGKLDCFPANDQRPDSDVVILRVESPDLFRLNRDLSDYLPHTDTYREYHPHLTIAYVKPGEGERFTGIDLFDGIGYEIEEVTFSSKTGDQTTIPLDGIPPPSIKEDGRQIRVLQIGADGLLIDAQDFLSKASQESVRYSDKASEPERQCQACKWFQAPSGCWLVEGKIKPQGTCDLWVGFEPKPNPDFDLYSVQAEAANLELGEPASKQDVANREGRPERWGPTKHWVTLPGGKRRFYPDSDPMTLGQEHQQYPPDPEQGYANPNIQASATHYTSNNGEHFERSPIGDPSVHVGTRVYAPGKYNHDPAKFPAGGGFISGVHMGPSGQATHYSVEMDTGHTHTVPIAHLHNQHLVVDNSHDLHIAENATDDYKRNNPQYFTAQAAKNAARYQRAVQKIVTSRPEIPDRPSASPKSPRMLSPVLPKGTNVNKVCLDNTILLANKDVDSADADAQVEKVLPYLPEHDEVKNTVHNVLTDRLLSDRAFATYAYETRNISHGPDIAEALSGKRLEKASEDVINKAAENSWSNDRERETHRNVVLNAVKGLVGEWAVSSGDHQPVSLAIQKAIAEEFGLEDAPLGPMRSHPGIEKSEKEALEKTNQIYQRYGSAYRTFARHVYENTQEWLHTHRIDSIPVYRGMMVDEYNDKELAHSGSRFRPDQVDSRDVSVNLQPATSWSTQYFTANNFSTNTDISEDLEARAESGEKVRMPKRVIFTAVIPRERIFSTCKSGQGSAAETEIITLGGRLPVSAHTWSSPIHESGHPNEKNVVYEDPDTHESIPASELSRRLTEQDVEKSIKAYFGNSSNKRPTGTKSATATNIEPDREVTNADWTKRSWDLPSIDSPEFKHLLSLNGLTLDQFKQLPSYQLVYGQSARGMGVSSNKARIQPPLDQSAEHQIGGGDDVFGPKGGDDSGGNFFVAEDNSLKKAAQDEAGYADRDPSGKHPCAACSHFQSPDQCFLVQGPIDRDGTCNFWNGIDDPFPSKENTSDPESDDLGGPGSNSDYSQTSEHVDQLQADLTGDAWGRSQDTDQGYWRSVDGLEVLSLRHWITLPGGKRRFYPDNYQAHPRTSAGAPATLHDNQGNQVGNGQVHQDHGHSITINNKNGLRQTYSHEDTHNGIVRFGELPTPDRTFSDDELEESPVSPGQKISRIPKGVTPVHYRRTLGGFEKVEGRPSVGSKIYRPSKTYTVQDPDNPSKTLRLPPDPGEIVGTTKKGSVTKHEVYFPTFGYGSRQHLPDVDFHNGNVVVDGTPNGTIYRQLLQADRHDSEREVSEKQKKLVAPLYESLPDDAERVQNGFGSNTAPGHIVRQQLLGKAAGLKVDISNHLNTLREAQSVFTSADATHLEKLRARQKYVDARKQMSDVLDQHRDKLHEALFNNGEAVLPEKLNISGLDDNHKKRADLDAAYDFIRRVVGSTTSPQLSEALSGSKPLQVNPKGSARPSYNPRTETLEMSAACTTSSYVHELAHYLESKDPDLVQREASYVRTRTAGEPLESMNALTGGHYYWQEITKADKFDSPYVGVLYSPDPLKSTSDVSGSEVLSMGLERLYSDPVGFAHADPDHFDFTINALRGGNHPLPKDGRE